MSTAVHLYSLALNNRNLFPHKNINIKKVFRTSVEVDTMNLKETDYENDRWV